MCTTLFSELVSTNVRTVPQGEKMRNKRRVIACLNIDVLGDNSECEASQTNIEQTAENSKRIVFIFRVGHCAFN